MHAPAPNNEPFEPRKSGWARRLAAVLCMYAMDCLPNAMLSPIYVMVAGGLTGLLVAENAQAIEHAREIIDRRRHYASTRGA